MGYWHWLSEGGLLSRLSRFSGVSHCVTAETVRDSRKIKFPSREGARCEVAGVCLYAMPADDALFRKHTPAPLERGAITLSRPVSPCHGWPVPKKRDSRDSSSQILQSQDKIIFCAFFLSNKLQK